MDELSGGQNDDPKLRVDRLIAEGKMTAVAVRAAEMLWRARLRQGVLMPHGEVARIELPDLYHLIVDDRIWRHPERIEQLLRSIFEIREAREQRRRALARWMEGETEHIAYAILEPDGRVRTMHVIDARRLARYRRREILLWTS